MSAKTQVKSRLVFFDDAPFQKDTGGSKYLDVISTFNMTERRFLDRQPDMKVENEDGKKYRIKKEVIAYVSEIKMVAQEIEEVKSKE